MSDGASLKSSHTTKQAIFKYMANNYPILYSAHLKHPEKSRRALWIKLTPSKKYKVWENHFRDILVNVSLTKEQKTLLKKISKKLSPDFFNKNADRSDFNNSKRIKEIKNVFGGYLGRAIFISLETAPEINKGRKS
jgi:hypothetical protein